MRGKFILLSVMLVLFCLPVFSDTLLDYGGDMLPEGKLQATYKEKYFEYNIYYKYFNFFSEGFDKEDVYDGSFLKGMQHNFIVRLGLPWETVLNMDAMYIYQRMDDLDYNDLHSLSLFGEKYFGPFGLLAGLRLPFNNEIPDDVRFVDTKGRYNFIAGTFIKDAGDVFNYSLQVVFEKYLAGAASRIPINIYFWEMSLSASAGFRFFKSEHQSIDFILEAAYRTVNYEEKKSVVSYIVPQVRIEFYNDFYLVAGIEVLAHAENIFLNKFFIDDDNKIFYLAKLNYVINSDKRKKVEKEEEKVDTTKTWKEQNIDPEMVPDWWKEEDNKIEGNKDEGKTGHDKE